MMHSTLLPMQVMARSLCLLWADKQIVIVGCILYADSIYCSTKQNIETVLSSFFLLVYAPEEGMQSKNALSPAKCHFYQVDDQRSMLIND